MICFIIVYIIVLFYMGINVNDHACNRYRCTQNLNATLGAK